MSHQPETTDLICPGEQCCHESKCAFPDGCTLRRGKPDWPPVNWSRQTPTGNVSYAQ